MEAISYAKKAVETDDTILALEQLCFDYVMLQGDTPERVTLEQFISFVEEKYGVEVQIAGRQGVATILEETDARRQDKNDV